MKDFLQGKDVKKYMKRIIIFLKYKKIEYNKLKIYK